MPENRDERVLRKSSTDPPKAGSLGDDFLDERAHIFSKFSVQSAFSAAFWRQKSGFGLPPNGGII
ncbi:MAG: hypothetical protein HY764_02735 [Candidatus Portnoybacteria bacterium]|nr:hypothetical protein [Candidatus Portnoybacteria bacterium]